MPAAAIHSAGAPPLLYGGRPPPEDPPCEPDDGVLAGAAGFGLGLGFGLTYTSKDPRSTGVIAAPSTVTVRFCVSARAAAYTESGASVATGCARATPVGATIAAANPTTARELKTPATPRRRDQRRVPREADVAVAAGTSAASLRSGIMSFREFTMVDSLRIPA